MNVTLSNKKNNFLIIMAGGIGSRFWPMSTKDTPKQFLDILGTGKTMIQQTVSRLKGIIPDENIYIVTSVAYKKIVKEQLPMISDNQILLEPCMRNTAPCIAYATYKIRKTDPKGNIVVAPSDHLITDENEYFNIIKQALEFTANNNALVTLGMTPHKPDTGYGYIKVKSFYAKDSFVKVEQFCEKPNLEDAEKYFASSNYFWNAGIFIWTVESIIQAFEKHLPKLSTIFEDLSDNYNSSEEQALINEHFPQCENISIDYGIMERAQNIYVLPASFGWSDLGTWSSLWEKRFKDNNENAIVGSNIHTFDCANTVVTVPNDKTVVLQGLSDYIVTDANNILLICKKEEEQRIKEFREIATKTE